MTRLFFTALLGLFLLGPVLLPVAELARTPAGWAAWGEAGRIGTLLGNTLGLAALSCLVAVPAGTAAALLLERFVVPGRNAARAVLALGLFVPLPVYAVAWQVVLGSWLPPLRLVPGEVAWRPWGQGLLPAAWVHGMAGLPWVAWIVGAGLRAADRPLEDDALLAGGPGAVVRLVLLPRALLAAAAAAGWVAVQAATEIAVTDAMMVRTVAEEVYTQAVGFPAGVAGAVAVTVPVWLAAAGVAGWSVHRLGRRLPAGVGDVQPASPLPLSVGGGRIAAVALWLGVGLCAGLPLAALVWKAGGGSSPAGWSLPATADQLARTAGLQWDRVLGSLLAAGAAGVLSAGLAVLACRLAVGSRWFAAFLLAVAVVVWLTPGPLVGLGMKGAIETLIDWESRLLVRLGITLDFPPLRSALYDQPSPLPAIWAATVRLFPLAVAFLWPAVRAVPRDLLDAARLDGAGPWGVWRLVVWPSVRPAFASAAVGVTALALGEVSASKLVEVPGRTGYILEVFSQMHYGAEASVAALCLLQVAATGLVAGLLLWRPANPG